MEYIVYGKVGEYIVENWGKEPYPTPSLISDSRKIAFPIHLACRLGLWLFLHTIYTGDIDKIFKHAIIEISSLA